MIGVIERLDKTLFIFINHLPHNIIFDSIFLFFSGVGSFGLVWMGIAIALFVWEEWRDKKGFIALIIALILSILISEVGLKNIIKRPRPQFVISETILVGDSRDTYSFPSSHATIAFAAAFVLTVHHKKGKWYYFLLAILISFSRIYLGKHFPSDVLAGAFIGTIIGYLSIKTPQFLARA